MGEGAWVNLKNDIVVRITGTAGEGVLLAGELLGQAIAHSGRHAMVFNSFPAEVRGGKCTSQVRISDVQVLSQGEAVDLWVALSLDDFERHARDLKSGGILLFDPKVSGGHEELFAGLPAGAVSIPLAFTEISMKHVLKPLAMNIVALGGVAKITGLPLRSLEILIEEKFTKDEKIKTGNLNALRGAYDALSGLDTGKLGFRFPDASGEDKIVISGNQAVGLAALAAECRLFAGYPITPATDIMQYVAREIPQYGGVTVQTEDEISAVAAAVGSSFTGRRAMTATSGPGLSLMSEMINLSTMAEVPLVVVNVQRGGPATGLPTKVEQSDLNIALFGAHGDSPRIVLAPSNPEECFYLTFDAFNLAEKYQLPVIVLSDQFIGQRKETVRPFEKDRLKFVERLKPTLDELASYQRYKLTESGISPRTVPGEPSGLHVATAIEHNERGLPNYEPENHRLMTEKRYRKLAMAGRELSNRFIRFGPEKADLGIVGWGSTEGAVREAVEIATISGASVSAFYPKCLMPLPEKALENFFSSVAQVLVIELNFTGQLAGVLREKFRIEVHQLNVFEGRPIRVSEVVRKIEEIQGAREKAAGRL